MATDKWIKNTTVGDKTYLNQIIGPSEYYQIQPHELNTWAYIPSLLTDIASGDAVVARDDSGTTDFSAADGKDYLQFQLAIDSPFDNSTNGFTATDEQAAIKEARDSGIGTVLPYPFLASGNTADKWLGTFEAQFSSNVTPLIVPQDSDLKGMLWMNQDDDVDIDVEVYRNATLVKTFEVRNKRMAWVVGISPAVSFNQGDRISVFLKKYTGGTGDQTAQNPVVQLLCKFTAEVGADSGIQTGL